MMYYQNYKNNSLKSIYDSELVKKDEEEKKEDDKDGNIVTAIASSLGLSKLFGIEERQEQERRINLSRSGIWCNKGMTLILLHQWDSHRKIGNCLEILSHR